MFMDKHAGIKFFWLWNFLPPFYFENNNIPSLINKYSISITKTCVMELHLNVLSTSIANLKRRGISINMWRMKKKISKNEHENNENK